MGGTLARSSRGSAETGKVRGRSRWAHALAALAFFALVAVLRDAGGGAGAAVTPLIALPVVWFALFGTRPELALSVAGAALVILLPVALWGPDRGYPGSELAGALVWAGVLAAAGSAISAVVSRYEARLEEAGRLARTDPLTGLANRRAWEEQVSREVSRATRTGGTFSVAMLDFDLFKRFNDERGHGPGDRLLREAAAMWSTKIRDMDLIARHGGDEFCVLLPATALSDAATIAERLRRCTPRGVTASAGVAEWDGAETPEELLARADAALYAAKRSGGDSVSPGRPMDTAPPADSRA